MTTLNYTVRFQKTVLASLIGFCIRIEFFDPQQFVLSTYKNQSFTTEIEETEIYVGEEEVFLTNQKE